MYDPYLFASPHPIRVPTLYVCVGMAGRPVGVSGPVGPAKPFPYSEGFYLCCEKQRPRTWSGDHLGVAGAAVLLPTVVEDLVLEGNGGDLLGLLVLLTHFPEKVIKS